MSADTVLGVPFNIASYAMLTMMIAHCLDTISTPTGDWKVVPGDFIHTLGDAHVYLNHIETYQKEQRNNPILPSPKLILNPDKRDLFEFKTGDFTLVDYTSGPAVKYPIAV